jgi:hypothetical protein
MFPIAHFAFPDNKELPPQRPQCGLMPQIPLPVTLEFGEPEIQSGFGQSGQFAGWIGVAVPKAAVDEDGLATAREYEVGGTWELSLVKAISEAQGVHEPPDRHLRLAIPASHLGHAGTAFSRRQGVHNPLCPPNPCRG